MVVFLFFVKNTFEQRAQKFVDISSECLASAEGESALNGLNFGFIICSKLSIGQMSFPDLECAGMPRMDQVVKICFCGRSRSTAHDVQAFRPVDSLSTDRKSVV